MSEELPPLPTYYTVQTDSTIPLTYDEEKLAETIGIAACTSKDVQGFLLHPIIPAHILPSFTKALLHRLAVDGYILPRKI